jgi:hypothetical protein
VSAGLGLRRIDGPVTSARRTGRLAWYWLPPQRWSFRTDAERVALLEAGATRYAALVGRRLHIRVTSRPYPVERWARSVDEAFPDPLPEWAAHLRAEQQHILGLTLAGKEVYVGVQLHVPAARGHAAVEERRTVDAVIAGAGLEGRPATPAELEYLLHRSACLGSPAPSTLPPDLPDWEEDDVAAFTDRADWAAAPFARTVRIVSEVDGRRHARHVAVVTLGRVSSGLDIPGGMGPWMQRADRLPFPVEWSVLANVLPAAKVQRDVHTVMSRIKAQLAHYAEHEETPPAALARQHERAVTVEDEVTTPNPLHTRVEGWWRAAVAGPTEQDALERAALLADLYLPGLPFTRTADQFRVAREFIPGEPLASTAHRRRMPVTTFAAAAPQVTALVGDRAGFHLGSTAGDSRRAVCWHPWAAMEERERSGTTIVAGTLGSGKSTLCGVVAHWAALARVRSVILDPSGPLARLARVPELAPYARAVDLMNADPGALNPYAVIGDPRREHYVREDGTSDEVAWARAVRGIEATRRRLCVDTLMALLPLPLLQDPHTHIAVTDAARRVRAVRTASPRQVIAELGKLDGSLTEHGGFLARTLDDLAEQPQTQLIFPAAEGADMIRDDLVLQVLTMRGNVLPDPAKPRDEWTIAETVGMPLMTLAATLTQQHVYSGSMDERKLVIMDEVDQLLRVSVGQAVTRQLCRDTRKHNTRAILCGQNTSDSLAAGIENFVDNAFVGRTEGEAEQASALQTLGVQRGVGYEQVLASLSPRHRASDERTGTRQFVWKDGDGGIEKIHIDRPAALADVLDTTADPRKLPALAGAVAG